MGVPPSWPSHSSKNLPPSGWSPAAQPLNNLEAKSIEIQSRQDKTVSQVLPGSRKFGQILSPLLSALNDAK